MIDRVKFHPVLSSLALIAFSAFAFVQSLDPYPLYSEGSCSSINWAAAPRVFNESFFEWTTSLTFIPMASKYHFYRAASLHAFYVNSTEKDIENLLCLSRSAHMAHGVGQTIVSGLGMVLAEYDITTGTDETGRFYWDHTPRRPRPSWDKVREYITLSDGLSWAFIVACSQNSAEKSWSLVSLTPDLSPILRKAIMTHALILGFQQENFVSLRYEKCGRNRPLFDYQRINVRRSPRLHKTG